MKKVSSHWCLGVALITALALGSCTTRRSKDPPNTIYSALGARVKSLDPIYADDAYTNPAVAKIYETLYQYHYLKRPLELEGSLAKAMPVYSSDRKTLTIQLKKGVLFQDDPCFKATGGKGRELVASDFVYSFMRLADPHLRSNGWWIFDGKIAGLNEWRKKSIDSKKSDYTAKIEGLEAVDSYTLKIKLTKPSEQFLFYLAMPFSSAVAKEAVEKYGEDFRRSPVGTGPYVYDRKASNLSSKLIFNKNPTYRNEYYPSEGEASDKANGLLADAGKKLPLNDKIVLEIFQESQPMWLKFMAGEIDASGIPKDSFSSVIESDGSLSQEMKSQGVRLVTATEPGFTFVGFNMQDPVIGKNIELRRAISRAYDNAPVIEIFYNGRAIPAEGAIPPGLSGYDPKTKNINRDFNLEEAKKHLAKAGYGKGKKKLTLEYITNVSTTGRQMSELLKKQMDALGIELKVKLTTWPEFQNAINNKKAQIFGMAWRGDYPDAENFLQLYYSKNFAPFGSNYFFYKNPKYDALYERSLRLGPGPKRAKLYKQMNEMLMKEVPNIFGAHRIRYALIRPWLKNYKMIDFEHNYLKYFRIDTALRSKKK